MTTISSILVDCLKRFNNLIDSQILQRYASEVPEDLWQDELGRLRVWAANIGAHQVGQSSLDYRLRDASNVKEQAIRLLKGLQRAFDDLDEVINEEAQDAAPDEDDSDLDDMYGTEIQQIYKGAVNTIDCLFQMSMVIRRPAPHDRLAGTRKADTAIFEPYDRQHVENKYPKAERQVVDRLGMAISRRRADLKYRERHHAKMGKGLRDQPETVSTILSETIATEFEDEQQHIQFDDAASEAGLSQTSYAQTLMQSGDKISIPPPPKNSLGEKPFECPYCFYIITVRDRRAWARHVFTDLMPYVCIFPDCSTPSTMYTSRREWYHHLHTSHSVPSKGESDFNCPLCQEYLPQGARPERHIGRHLEELALFAIPRTNEEEEDDDEDDGRSEDDSEARSVSDVSEGARPGHNGHLDDDVAGYDGQDKDEHILSLIRDRLTTLCSQYIRKLPRDPNERGLEIAKVSKSILENIASSIPSLWDQLTPDMRLTLTKGLQEMLKREVFDLPETVEQQGRSIGDEDMVSQNASEERHTQHTDDENDDGNPQTQRNDEPNDEIDEQEIMETVRQKLVELGHDPEEVEATLTQKNLIIKAGTTTPDDPQEQETTEETGYQEEEEVEQRPAEEPGSSPEELDAARSGTEPPTVEDSTRKKIYVDGPLERHVSGEERPRRISQFQPLSRTYDEDEDYPPPPPHPEPKNTQTLPDLAHRSATSRSMPPPKITQRQPDNTQKPVTTGSMPPPTDRLLSPYSGDNGIVSNDPRWTKIDRRLVNPQALEMSHERFVERNGFVVVQRVLTKEEIQVYADKTREIRTARYKASKQERRRVREERRRNGHFDSSSSDDEHDGYEAAPAIEAPPTKEPRQSGHDISVIGDGDIEPSIDQKIIDLQEELRLLREERRLLREENRHLRNPDGEVDQESREEVSGDDNEEAEEGTKKATKTSDSSKSRIMRAMFATLT